MEKPSYTLGTPLYENTQGAETNNKIVWGNIILGLLAASFWGIFSWMTLIDHPNTPSLIKVPVLVTALLLLDRAAWMLYHTLKNSTVTDSSGAYNFERTSFLLPLLLILITKSYEELRDGQCEPKPVIGTILNNGKAIIVEDTGDNTLDFCDFIQNEATPTLMWALCTVPLLLLFGAGWKTLKATRKSDKKEAVWLPSLGIINLLCCIAQSLKWLFSRMVPILIILIVAIVVLLAVAVLHCLQWLSKLLRRLRSQFH